jgi:hypothetical protein
MYQWRKYIAVALSGLTLLACRGDDVVEIPESVYQVRIESSGITLPRGGSAVIPFRITEGALPAGGSIELSLRNGAVPAEFRLDGIEPKGNGLYEAGITDAGTSGAYSREACLSLTFRSATGRDVHLRSNFTSVNCGLAEYGWNGNTGLPVIYIDTVDGKAVDSRSVEVPAVLKIKGAGEYGDMLPASCNIRGRGNTTWKWDKKPYQIEFCDRVPMLGMPACSRWILLANFADRTLMRNIVAMKVASITSYDWVPRCVPFELVLNGSHRGNYLLIEKVEVDPARVALSEDGYLLELDFHYDNDVQWIDPHGKSLHRTGIPFAVKYPSPEALTPEKVAYIKKYIFDTAESIYSESPERSYESWIDVDSFINYWLVYELLSNQELGNPGSVFMHIDAGEKLKAGPCWDFDWGMLRLYTSFQTRLGIVNKKNLWYEKLFPDPVFSERVRNRFIELLPALQEVAGFIEECGKLLQASAGLNFAMWDPSEDRWQHQGILINGDENYSFEDAVVNLRQVYLDRLELLKNNL